MVAVKPFKMKVTPGQSALVQDFLFRHGYSWASMEKLITFTDWPFLFFENDELTCGKSNEYYEIDPLPKLSFKTFDNKYMQRETDDSNR